MLKQLYYGSLQDHMRTSRREMNQSYVLQQQQLMRMNVMRESQRMMLTQAETLVRLNQLRDEVIKALPPKNVKVVIPTSNAALEETLSSVKQPQTQVTMEEEIEGKRAPPKSLKVSTSNSLKGLNVADLDVIKKARGSPSEARAASRSSSQASSRSSSQASSRSSSQASSRSSSQASSRSSSQTSSPTASLAPTVASSQDPSLLSTASNQPGSPKDDLDIKLHFGRERKLLKESVKRAGARDDGMSEVSQDKALTAIKAATSVAELKIIEHELINGKSKFQASDLVGNGLKRHRAKSGRFVKSKR